MSVARGCFLCGDAFGIVVLSVIRSNEVSIVEGFLMYGSLWINNRDPKVCPLYRRCPPLRGVRLAGFHCMLNPTICYKTGFEIHEQVKNNELQHRSSLK